MATCLGFRTGPIKNMMHSGKEARSLIPYEQCGLQGLYLVQSSIVHEKSVLNSVDLTCPAKSAWESGAKSGGGSDDLRKLERLRAEVACKNTKHHWGHAQIKARLGSPVFSETVGPLLQGPLSCEKALNRIAKCVWLLGQLLALLRNPFRGAI